MTRNSKVPPGPTGLAKFRSWRDFFLNPLDLLNRLAKEYGEVVNLSVPGTKLFVLNEPRDIETVLRHRAANFTKDQFLQVSKVLFGDGLLTSEGELWRRQRK